MYTDVTTEESPTITFFAKKNKELQDEDPVQSKWHCLDEDRPTLSCPQYRDRHNLPFLSTAAGFRVLVWG